MSEKSSDGAMPDAAMNDIMATIRRIVADAPPPPLGEVTFRPSPQSTQVPAMPEAPAAATPAPTSPTPTSPTPTSPTIDAFLRSMLEPMLKAWLDANLPEIVERVTEAEVRRLTKTDD